MKESMDEGLNLSSLPVDVRDSIRLDTRVANESLLKAVAENFGGQTIAWTGRDGLREALLESTPVFPHQLNELRQVLINRGWKVPGKRIHFRVPNHL
jgi:hypothetical protein